MLALLRLAGVAGDVGLQPAVAAQRDGQVDARSEQQRAEGDERDERRRAVADHGAGFGEFEAVHVVAQADGLAPFLLSGPEDRVLHLPRAVIGGERLFVTACAGEHQAPVAVYLADLRGIHPEIALALADHRDQRVAVEDALRIVAPDAFPEIAQLVKVGFVAQQVFAPGVQHAPAELIEMHLRQIVAPDVERAADQLPERVHVAVVPVEVGAPSDTVLFGIVGVEHVDIVGGQRFLFVVAFGLVVGAAEEIVDQVGEVVPDDRAGHPPGEFESLLPEPGLGDEGVAYPFFVVIDRHPGVAFEQEPLHPVENVVRVRRVVFAPPADGVCQPERLFPVVYVAQTVESDAHFGIGVHPLLGGSGRQFPQFRDAVTERVFLLGVGGVLRDDGHGGYGHGIGVSDGSRLAEELDRKGQVEVRIFVDVLQVEQQLRPFFGVCGVRQHLLQAVGLLPVRPCARNGAHQNAYREE